MRVHHTCIDNFDGTVTFELNILNEVPIYGFQFTIDPGETLLSGVGAQGGLSAEADFIVQIGENGIILGFSMSSIAIQAVDEFTNLTNFGVLCVHTPLSLDKRRYT